MPVFKSGIVIPPREFTTSNKGKTKFGWVHSWKVGDCIEIDSEKECQKIDNAIRRLTEGKVVRRKVTENDQTFYRMWRVA